MKRLTFMLITCGAVLIGMFAMTLQRTVLVTSEYFKLCTEEGACMGPYRIVASHKGDAIAAEPSDVTKMSDYELGQVMGKIQSRQEVLATEFNALAGQTKIIQDEIDKRKPPVVTAAPTKVVPK